MTNILHVWIPFVLKSHWGSHWCAFWTLQFKLSNKAKIQTLDIHLTSTVCTNHCFSLILIFPSDFWALGNSYSVLLQGHLKITIGLTVPGRAETAFSPESLGSCSSLTYKTYFSSFRKPEDFLFGTDALNTGIN